ncbi:MAG: phosphoribosylglycinamide formyltransferase [Candidatus Omnitrophica bacterium]|nr:phosphoribosylglycinamide formyltransferase [Candidatus Omnitrophota bacterium]MDD5236153.1 phosphoribosylglycinamide formyltransferase [Candidatus Omnitrophota bacterium]MDD5611357.1 phosphoribosylglycinamide formyltransferase [Candidatus Omnitrophota bacterium]
MNIAVFCSGNGTNLQAIINAIKKGKLAADLALVVSDNSQAYALKRARRAKIKTVFIDPAQFRVKSDFEAKLTEYLMAERISLIVLAGFMRILSSEFVMKFRNKIINIHPALLPSFKGSHGIKDAFDYGVKVTGVTVHFVDEKMDHGPIILQQALKIEEGQTLEALEAKIHKIEHKLYPEAIRLFTEGKLEINGRKVKILS